MTESHQVIKNAQLIPVDLIDPNPFQPRGELKTSDVSDLMHSIKDVGVLQPLLATPRDERYILIAGHRRLAAAKEAELTEIPCIISELSDEALLQYSLIENLQREDLSPLEEAGAIKQLIESQGLDHRKVAELIGKSKTYVTERLALLDLTDDLKRAVSQGVLSMKKADALKKLNDEKVRARLIEKAPSVNVDKLKALVKKAEAGRKPREKWDVHQGLMDFSKSTEGVRLYKDRISFKFDTEESLLELLTKIMEMLKGEDKEE